MMASKSITYDKHYVHPPVPGMQGRPSPDQGRYRDDVSESRRIPKSLRFEVLARDGYTCRYCGRRPPEAILELDHMVSWRDGGRTTLGNLVTSCRDCNRGKSSKSVSS
ncbi:MAG: HNH endonuclease [Candidatus Thermoplasmatota archaeon]|nr:HNH endonuclease [Candidatus Thermoplasmatota archaeon]MBU1914326.1 HNH endonuclease [Candidatus Thermoplasmatota archaeon]